MCTSVEIKSCFYISKFCYPQRASLYSENLQTMTETEKQLLSQGDELWRRLILGKKKYTTAWGIYRVYIINCGIYNTLMKDDEIISHLPRKGGKLEINYPANNLVLQHRLHQVKSAYQLNSLCSQTTTTQEVREAAVTGLRWELSSKKKKKSSLFFSILWIIKDIKSPCNSKKMACRGGNREEVKSF